MDLQLDGRVAVVTGGSSGVGLATVQRLLDEGALVAACARDLDRLRTATAALDRDRLLVGACDVTDASQVGRFAEQVEARFGRIDGLVLNAGQARLATFAQTSIEDWKAELALKFDSVLHMLHGSRGLLTDDASVVIVNAELARQPEPHMVATSAARAGVLNLARSLSRELAPVRVNSVLLGLIDTGQWRRRHTEDLRGLSYEAWTAEVALDRGIPLGRLGRADEVAAMIVVLLSGVSSYVTGASVEVSGGIGRHV